MTPSIRKMVRIATALGLLAALGLLFGCAKTAATPASGSESTAAAESGPMTVELLNPTEGATVPAGTVLVKVKTSGIKFVMPSNTLVDGEGHVHFTLDDRPFIMSTEPQAELEDVSPGKHTLHAELVQNNTQPFDPPIAQTIEFTAE